MVLNVKLQASKAKRFKSEEWKTIKKSEKPLPRPFQLPENYPRIVQEGLAVGSLTGRARTKFLTTVAEAVHMHKLYPTQEEYEHVAKRIVERYGFMHQGSGTGHVWLFNTAITFITTLIIHAALPREIS